MTTQVKTFQQALEQFKKAMEDFSAICAEGRKSPIPYQAFVENKIAYDIATKEMYTALFMAQAGTGVQFLRKDGTIETIGEPLPKKE